MAFTLDDPLEIDINGVSLRPVSRAYPPTGSFQNLCTAIAITTCLEAFFATTLVGAILVDAVQLSTTTIVSLTLINICKYRENVINNYGTPVNDSP